MKEQIEELGKEIFKNCNAGLFEDEAKMIAEFVIEKQGYHKQSEGEWQTASDGTHWCSECGHDATYTFDGTEICGVACTFCGAKMKGANDERTD